ECAPTGPDQRRSALRRAASVAATPVEHWKCPCARPYVRGWKHPAILVGLQHVLDLTLAHGVRTSTGRSCDVDRCLVDEPLEDVGGVHSPIRVTSRSRASAISIRVGSNGHAPCISLAVDQYDDIVAGLSMKPGKDVALKVGQA